ncbi:MAG TPA: hypothetical protein VGO93_24750 [Candidatus Xenobia bacterium]|jgi:hypothetical protein
MHKRLAAILAFATLGGLALALGLSRPAKVNAQLPQREPHPVMRAPKPEKADRVLV